jgi:hypothetical protein
MQAMTRLASITDPRTALVNQWCFFRCLKLFMKTIIKLIVPIVALAPLSCHCEPLPNPPPTTWSISVAVFDPPTNNATVVAGDWSTNTVDTNAWQPFLRQPVVAGQSNYTASATCPAVPVTFAFWGTNSVGAGPVSMISLAPSWPGGVTPTSITHTP